MLKQFHCYDSAVLPQQDLTVTISLLMFSVSKSLEIFHCVV